MYQEFYFLCFFNKVLFFVSFFTVKCELGCVVSLFLILKNKLAFISLFHNVITVLSTRGQSQIWWQNRKSAVQLNLKPDNQLKSLQFDSMKEKAVFLNMFGVLMPIRYYGGGHWGTGKLVNDERCQMWQGLFLK